MEKKNGRLRSVTSLEKLVETCRGSDGDKTTVEVSVADLRSWQDHVQRLEASLRINIMRLSPGQSHEEIDRLIEVLK